MTTSQFKVLPYIVLVVCLLQVVSFYRMTSKQQHTMCWFTTDDGATVHPRIDGSDYGSPIPGDFLIQGPEDKYMGITEVRKQIIIIGALLNMVIIFSISRDRKEAKKSTVQSDSARSEKQIHE